MTDARKTAIAVALAAVVAALTWATGPSADAPASIQERGTPFFPAFQNPADARSLEVVAFDEAASSVRALKVVNRDGRWTMPSHYDYPADGRERLAAVAATMSALKREDLASENAADQERCGVVDPADETQASASGRGVRITVRGANDTALADLIVGRAVEGRPALRYVRLPGAARIYVANVGDLTASTHFQDWIERDLLLVGRDEIDQIIIRGAAVDRQSGNIDVNDISVLRRRDIDRWELDANPAGTARRDGTGVDMFKVNLLITKLDELTVDDVRPKPAGVVRMLTVPNASGQMARADLADLESKGFFATLAGHLVANSGDVLVHTTSGVFYTLRFGNAVAGQGDGEKRYLFVSAGYDAAGGGAPSREAEERLALLRARFAPWYFIVSDESFRKIRLRRDELVKP
jgi:hypothetical protein